MKKTLLTFTLLAGLSSCTNLSEDLDMIGTQNITQTKSGNLSISENEPAIVKDLRNYISQIKLQGKQARVLTSYTLTPYIYKEDTIMYIANYEDGWELLSTDHRVPLVMASSDTGQFNISDTTSMNPALLAYLNSLEKELFFIKQIENTQENTYNLWQAITLSNKEINPDSIQINPKVLETLPKAAALSPGSGYWELISTSAPKTSTTNIGHIIKTNWGQDSPWNEYVPYKYGTSGSHCPAGCTAIAGAQYLYYLHYKNNKPVSTVTTATYNSSNNTYTYTGNNSTVWNQMAKNQSASSGQAAAAIFIGYVGQQINTKYGINESGSNRYYLADFLNQLGYNYTVKDIDYSYIITQLYNNIPTVISIFNKDAGHTLICDRYKKITTTTTSTFGWVGTDNLGNDSNERDEAGNIIGYTFTYERENLTNATHQLGMNWGYDGSYDYLWLEASSYSDWVSNTTYDTERYMLK